MSGGFSTGVMLRRGLLTVAAVAVLTAAITAGNYWIAIGILQDEIHLRLRAVAEDCASMLDAYVAEQKDRARLVSTRTRLRRLLELQAAGRSDGSFEQESREILLDARRSTPEFEEIWISDRQGRVVSSTDPRMLGDSVLEHAAFRPGKSVAYLDVPEVGEDGRYRGVVSAPARGRDGSVIGVVMIRMRMERLRELLAGTSNKEAAQDVLVGRRVGSEVEYLFPRGDGRRRDRAEAVQAMADAIAGVSGFAPTSFAGEQVLAWYRPVAYQPPEHEPWGMVAKVAEARAYAPIAALVRWHLIAGATALVGALVFGLPLLHRMSRPLQQLANAAELLRGGAHSVRVPESAARGEMKSLVGAFNRMAEQLDQSHAGLTRQRAQLEIQNEELRRKNRELEQFNYLASHDLQEPLRMVTSYAELLRGEDSEQLETKTRRHLGYVSEGAARMQVLIDGLLSYSRAGRADQPLESVDLDELLEHVLRQLDERIVETGAKVRAGPLPRVLGDAVALQQLLQNLISNALKFRGEAPAQVEISARPVDEGWEVSVADSGIGIEARHQERIFEPFERLHHADEYPGSGIGLAICSNVVRRHGGRLWVVSSPGRGSVFRFTLKAA